MELVQAALSPAHLGAWLDTSFQVPKHIDLLSRTVAEHVARGDGRVIVCMPPRHGKSTVCSKWLPIWALELFGPVRVVLGTYAQNYSKLWGRTVRDTIRQYNEQGQLTIGISDTKSTEAEWETTAGGSMLAVGIGGGLFGRGADVAIIDDPIADAEQANSEVYRDKTWRWWTDTLSNRLEPGGSVVIVMTRYHEDDLVGRLLESEHAHEWTMLKFPAIAEGPDDLGRKEGDPLWPERWTLARLEGRRIHSSPHAWSALYQQSPAPIGGAVFQREHFRYFTHAPDHKFVLRSPGVDEPYVVRMDQCWCAQVTDTAMTEKALSDWTVVLTYGITPRGDMLVLDVARKRLEVPDQWDYVMAQRAKWRGGQVRWRWIGCENKMSGIGLLQLAKRRRIPMRELDAVSDKGTRASDAATLYQRGIVWHLRDAAWVGPYEKELCEFPYGAHDDQVDVIAYAARSYDEKGVIDVSGPRDYGPSEYEDPDRLQGGSFDVIGESPEW